MKGNEALNNWEELVISNDHARFAVTPMGAVLTMWAVKHPESGDFINILYHGRELRRTGIPLLFPFAGRLKNDTLKNTKGKLAQHGFARDHRWRVVADGSDGVEMILNSEVLSQDEKNAYPFEFEAHVGIELEEEGDLIYNLSVRNQSTYPMPIAPGLHPYYRVDHESKMSLKIDEIPKFDAFSIDWDSHPPNDSFDYDGDLTIHLPQEIIVHMSDETLDKPVTKKITIWSEPRTMADYDFVCVEPWVGEPNTINTHPIMVPPGGVWNMSMKFEVEFI